MSADTFDTDTIEANGRRYRVEYCYDQDHEAPWDDGDGRGIVSKWTTRDKAPGESVLTTDRHSLRYYDVKATLRKAKAEGWGASGGPRAGESTRAQLARAVDEDFEFCRSWCADEWHYAGVVVTLLDERGKATDYTESLWGVETAHDYHRTIPAELIEEIEARLTRERVQLAPRVDPDPGVNWQNDAIQFPRLLAELWATVDLSTGQLDALAASMDLSVEQVSELFERAQLSWQAIVAKTPAAGEAGRS
jgi:hypothetical protein